MDFPQRIGGLGSDGRRHFVRLLVGKSSQLPVGLIATVVEDAYMHFEQSVIRDYIPLLVERRAHNELARLASDLDLSIELTPTA